MCQVKKICVTMHAFYMEIALIWGKSINGEDQCPSQPPSLPTAMPRADPHGPCTLVLREQQEDIFVAEKVPNVVSWNGFNLRSVYTKQKGRGFSPLSFLKHYSVLGKYTLEVSALRGPTFPSAACSTNNYSRSLQQAAWAQSLQDLFCTTSKCRCMATDKWSELPVYNWPRWEVPWPAPVNDKILAVTEVSRLAVGFWMIGMPVQQCS